MQKSQVTQVYKNLIVLSLLIVSLSTQSALAGRSGKSIDPEQLETTSIQDASSDQVKPIAEATLSEEEESEVIWEQDRVFQFPEVSRPVKPKHTHRRRGTDLENRFSRGLDGVHKFGKTILQVSPDSTSPQDLLTFAASKAAPVAFLAGPEFIIASLAATGAFTLGEKHRFALKEKEVILSKDELQELVRGRFHLTEEELVTLVGLLERDNHRPATAVAASQVVQFGKGLLNRLGVRQSLSGPRTQERVQIRNLLEKKYRESEVSSLEEYLQRYPEWRDSLNDGESEMDENIRKEIQELFADETKNRREVFAVEARLQLNLIPQNRPELEAKRNSLKSEADKNVDRRVTLLERINQKRFPKDLELEKFLSNGMNSIEIFEDIRKKAVKEKLDGICFEKQLESYIDQVRQERNEDETLITEEVPLKDRQEALLLLKTATTAIRQKCREDQRAKFQGLKDFQNRFHQAIPFEEFALGKWSIWSKEEATARAERSFENHLKEMEDYCEKISWPRGEWSEREILATAKNSSDLTLYEMGVNASIDLAKKYPHLRLPGLPQEKLQPKGFVRDGVRQENASFSETAFKNTVLPSFHCEFNQAWQYYYVETLKDEVGRSQHSKVQESSGSSEFWNSDEGEDNDQGNGAFADSIDLRL